MNAWQRSHYHQNELVLWEQRKEQLILLFGEGIPELTGLTWVLRILGLTKGWRKRKEVRAERRVGKGKGPENTEPGQEAMSSLVWPQYQYSEVVRLVGEVSLWKSWGPCPCFYCLSHFNVKRWKKWQLGGGSGDLEPDHLEEYDAAERVGA